MWLIITNIALFAFWEKYRVKKKKKQRPAWGALRKVLYEEATPWGPTTYLSIYTISDGKGTPFVYLTNSTPSINLVTTYVRTKVEPCIKPERFLDLFQPYIESVSPYEYFPERNDEFSCPFICFNSCNPYSFITTRKKPKNRYPFRSDHYGEYPPPPPLPAETEGTKQGGKHRAWRNFILVMKFLLQVARRERIKDAVIIKEEVRQCTWAKKSSEVWEEERTRSVCFGLIFAWQSLSPPISRLWAAQPVKKIHPPPTTLTTRPRQGAHDLNFELERGERIKKISVFFSSDWPTRQIFSFSRTDSNSGVEAQKTIL